MTGPASPPPALLSDTHLNHRTFSVCAMGVLTLGLLARIWLFLRIPLINPDGFLYIQQAKAIYYGLFSSVLDCYMYLSPYPLLIAAGKWVTGDWVTAAQWINIIFGTLVLVPLYLLLRRFFSDPAACLTVLAFALLPAYVMVSRDVLRDPCFWFFSMTGLYLFVRNLETPKVRYLLFSSLCLAMGAWARIEGSLFILVSAGFLLLFSGTRRWKETTVFLSPYLIAILAGILFSLMLDIQLSSLLKPERVLSRATDFFFRYEMLRDHLKGLRETWPFVESMYFFQEVRNLLWLVALAVLATQIIETLLYVLFIPLVIGFCAWMPKIRDDRRIAYLGVLCLMALALLYTQIIYNWVMTGRFTAVFLFPAAVFMGAGVNWLMEGLQSWFNWRKNRAVAVICMVTLAFLLPKTLRANYDDRLVTHQKIGFYIAELEKSRRPVSVCGAFRKIDAINFFANLQTEAAPCIDASTFLNISLIRPIKTVPAHKTDFSLQALSEALPMQTPSLTAPDVSDTDRSSKEEETSPPASSLKTMILGFDYFVWDSEGWDNVAVETMAPELSGHLEKLEQWSFGKSEKLILYRVVP